MKIESYFCFLFEKISKIDCSTYCWFVIFNGENKFESQLFSYNWIGFLLQENSSDMNKNTWARANFFQLKPSQLKEFGSCGSKTTTPVKQNSDNFGSWELDRSNYRAFSTTTFLSWERFVPAVLPTSFEI